MQHVCLCSCMHKPKHCYGTRHFNLKKMLPWLTARACVRACVLYVRVCVCAQYSIVSVLSNNNGYMSVFSVSHQVWYWWNPENVILFYDSTGLLSLWHTGPFNCKHLTAGLIMLHKTLSHRNNKWTELRICVHSNLLWTLTHNKKHPQYKTARWSRNTIYNNITNRAGQLQKAALGFIARSNPGRLFLCCKHPHQFSAPSCRN